jgi:hypothetical protein
LIAALELQAEQVQELIDFWHAVEYLSKIADSKKLQGAKRKHCLTIQKRRFLIGGYRTGKAADRSQVKVSKDVTELFPN